MKMELIIVSVAKYLKENFFGIHIIEDGNGEQGILCSIYIKDFNLKKLQKKIEEKFNKKFYIAQQDQYFVIYDNIENLISYWDGALNDIKIYK